MSNVHDAIISSITSALSPHSMELRLLARVADPLIGNDSDAEAFLFIPDLHLISPERQPYFGNYAFNFANDKILENVLLKLADLKEDLADDCKLITIQLGDFFDMWRENPGSQGSSAIADDTFGGLRDVLYRNVDRGGPCLKATMILGNHDTDLGVPLLEINSQLKAYNRSADQTPFLFTTHGDAFDLTEILIPDLVKEFAVQFAGNVSKVNPYSIDTWGKWEAKINKPLSDLKTAITVPEHDLDSVNGAPLVTAGAVLPDRMCRIVSSAEEDQGHYFKDLYNAFAKAQEIGLPGKSVNVAVIGHTHQASMVLYNPPAPGRSLLLLDCGAWIEKCKYPLAETGNDTVEPSAQIGVIHGNDARIYQIRMNASDS